MTYTATLEVDAVRFLPKRGAKTFDVFGWGRTVYWDGFDRATLHLPIFHHPFVYEGQWVVQRVTDKPTAMDVLDDDEFRTRFSPLIEFKSGHRGRRTKLRVPVKGGRPMNCPHCGSATGPFILTAAIIHPKDTVLVTNDGFHLGDSRLDTESEFVRCLVCGNVNELYKFADV